MVCPWTSPTSSGKLSKRPFHSRSSWRCQGPSWCLSSSNLQRARRDYFRNHGDLVHGYHKSSWLKQSNHRKPGPLPLAWLFTRYRRGWGLHSPEWYLILCNGLQSLTTTQDIPSHWISTWDWKLGAVKISCSQHLLMHASPTSDACNVWKFQSWHDIRNSKWMGIQHCLKPFWEFWPHYVYLVPVFSAFLLSILAWQKCHFV